MRTAIIGAGIAGLACAKSLADEGHEVTVYEASDHPGGRIATHRAPRNTTSRSRSIVCATEESVGASSERTPFWAADHGARAFSARFERFRAVAEGWIDAGVAARWRPSVVSISKAGAPVDMPGGPARFVGTPSMDAPIRALADELDGRVNLRVATPVRELHHTTRQWAVTTSEGETEAFDAVATAVPAPQAVGLLTEVAHLHTAAARVPMSPCWSLAVRFAGRLPIDFEAARISLGASHAHAGVLDWIDRESSKPGRSEDEVWVLHSEGQFAREHIHDDPQRVGAIMLDAFYAAVGIDPDDADPTDRHAHLWKAALPVAPLCDGCLYDESLRIGACGDWCMGARVEGAYLSGLAMADRLAGIHGDFLATCSRTPGTV